MKQLIKYYTDLQSTLYGDTPPLAFVFDAFIAGLLFVIFPKQISLILEASVVVYRIIIFMLDRKLDILDYCTEKLVCTIPYIWFIICLCIRIILKI